MKRKETTMYFYFVSTPPARFRGTWGGWAENDQQAVQLAERDLKHKLSEFTVWRGKPNPYL